MRQTLLAWLVFCLPGCSLGLDVTLFPGAHRLQDPTRHVLQPTVPELPRELNKAILAEYRVEPGDGLLVQPIDLDSSVRLPGDQTILPDGTIDLGKYGRLLVAGRTVSEIEELVNQAVKAKDKEEATAVNVRLVNRVSKVYYVLGEVNAPGAFPLAGRETVLDAIIAAGGLNDKASRRDIILSRPSHPDGCRTVLPVCYDHIVQLGDTSTNYQLAPGDRIFVPSHWFLDYPIFHFLKNSPCQQRVQIPCPQVAAECSLPSGTLPEPLPAPPLPAPAAETKPAANSGADR